MITSYYAAILATLFVVISLRVIAFRRGERIGLGDGGNTTLTRAIRVQSNFAEYVPFALVLMLLLELQNSPNWMLHLVGVLLLAGRLIHAVGFGREPEITGSRTVGMALTFTAILLAAAFNLAAPLLS